MAKTKLTNFRFAPDVKKMLAVCAAASGKNMTDVVSGNIRWGYRKLVELDPQKVKTIEAELEKHPDVAIQ